MHLLQLLGCHRLSGWIASLQSLLVQFIGAGNWGELHHTELEQHVFCPGQAVLTTPSCCAGREPTGRKGVADSVPNQHDAELCRAYAPHGYGYGGAAAVQQLLSRRSQFPQLSGITYLDHAAATLCSREQLQEAHAEQMQHLLANPHSQLPPGLDHSSIATEELRLMTLGMLNAPAEEYEVGCSHCTPQC